VKSQFGNVGSFQKERIRYGSTNLLGLFSVVNCNDSSFPFDSCTDSYKGNRQHVQSWATCWVWRETERLRGKNNFYTTKIFITCAQQDISMKFNTHESYPYVLFCTYCNDLKKSASHICFSKFIIKLSFT
jgi:hypothetical protein